MARVTLRRHGHDAAHVEVAGTEILIARVGAGIRYLHRFGAEVAHGEHNRETGAGSFAAAHFDFRAMCGGDALGEREAQAVAPAAAGSIGAVEALEDMRKFGFPNAGAEILYGNRDLGLIAIY